MYLFFGSDLYEVGNVFNAPPTTIIFVVETKARSDFVRIYDPATSKISNLGFSNSLTYTNIHVALSYDDIEYYYQYKTYYAYAWYPVNS